MSAAWWLREQAANMDRSIDDLTARIEEAERTIVDLRRKRDERRLNRADAMAAADFLDNHGFKVERDASGIVTVSIDPESVPMSPEP